MKNFVSSDDSAITTSESELSVIQLRLTQNQQEAEEEICEYISLLSSAESDKLEDLKELQRTELIGRFDIVLQSIDRNPLADYSTVIEKLSEIEDLANGITSTKMVHQDGSEHLIRDATKQDKMPTYFNLIGFASAMQKAFCEIRAAHALEYGKDYSKNQLDKGLKDIQSSIVLDIKNVLSNIASGNLNNAPGFNEVKFHNSIRRHLKESTKIERGKDDAIEKAREVMQIKDKQYHVSTLVKEKDAKGKLIYASKSHLLMLGVSDNQAKLYKAIADADGAKYKVSGRKDKKSVEIFNWYNGMNAPIRALISEIAPELMSGYKVIPYFSKCLPGLKNPKKLVEAAYTIEAEPQQLASAEIFSVAGIVAHKVITEQNNKQKNIFQRASKQDIKKQTELNIAHLTEIVGDKVQVLTIGNDKRSENKKLKQARKALAKKAEDPNVLSDFKIVEATDTKMLRNAIKTVVNDENNFLNTNSKALKKTRNFLSTNRVEELVGQVRDSKYEKVHKELDNFLAAHPEEGVHIVELKYLVDAKYKNRSKFFGKKPKEEDKIIDNLVARSIAHHDSDEALVISTSDASILDMLEIDSKAVQESRFIREGITSQEIKQGNASAHYRSNDIQHLVSQQGAHGYKDAPRNPERAEKIKTSRFNIFSRGLFRVGTMLLTAIKDVVMFSIDYLAKIFFPELVGNFSEDGSRDYYGNLEAQLHHVGISKSKVLQHDIVDKDKDIENENSKNNGFDLFNTHGQQQLYNGKITSLGTKLSESRDGEIVITADTGKSSDKNVDSFSKKYPSTNTQQLTSTTKINPVQEILEKGTTHQQDWKHKSSVITETIRQK